MIRRVISGSRQNGMRRAGAWRIRASLMAAGLVLGSGCSNSPYPGTENADEVIRYRAFSIPPKDFDPQRAYTTADNLFLSLCYERLVGYDYWRRPLELGPDLALAVPEAKELTAPDGTLTGVQYDFEIQPGVFFVDDPCFPEGRGRELKAADFVFVFKRLADPETNCPVVDSFSHILGFAEFRERVGELRKQTGGAGAGSVLELYDRAGPLEGIRITGDYTFELILKDRYPQILYWLAMRFASAIPWEAVVYYDGSRGTARGNEPLEFGQRPVGTGAYRFKWDEFNRDARIVMVHNSNWWGTVYPDRFTPHTRYAREPGEPGDLGIKAWRPERAGGPLALIDRVEWRLEREALSYFNKFLQGYYDDASVPPEMFAQVVQGNELTPEMEARGIRMVKDFGLEVYYIGFNMQDDAVGAPEVFGDPALEANRAETLARRRKLRQAMSLAIDSEEFLRIFTNRLGVPAQSPIPPGIFGYDPGRRNRYRQYDPELTLARQLLTEAGYPNGIDPATGNPLTLTFDAGSTDTRNRTIYNFYIDAWKRLGIDVRLEATDYNKFQEKMYAGAYQIFTWGWVADYPDPENFLFLLYGPNSSRYGGRKPNSTRFEHPRYDFLFKKMENIGNLDSATWTETDAATGQPVTVTRPRKEIMAEMLALLEEECPWIPLYHRETYLLYHEWLQDVKPFPISDTMTRYYSLDKDLRAQQRRAWNRPIRWPAAVLVVGLVLFLVPGIRTIRRERR